MALKKDDPWYVALPDSRSDAANVRYRRAVRLSEMREYISRVARMPEPARKRYASGVAYRQYCLANWEEYLDGKIETPTGRKMKQEGDD